MTHIYIISSRKLHDADPGGHAFYHVGLRLLACWDREFESRQGLGCLSLMCVVCFQVQDFATGRSPVQRSLTECGVSECDLGTSTVRRLRPTRAVEPKEEKIK